MILKVKDKLISGLSYGLSKIGYVKIDFRADRDLISEFVELLVEILVEILESKLLKRLKEEGEMVKIH